MSACVGVTPSPHTVVWFAVTLSVQILRIVDDDYMDLLQKLRLQLDITANKQGPHRALPNNFSYNF